VNFLNERRRIYTEGEEQDLHDKLMEMTGWTVTDKEKQNDSIGPLHRVDPCFPHMSSLRSGTSSTSLYHYGLTTISTVYL
jgi:hypothetical protein